MLSNLSCGPHPMTPSTSVSASGSRELATSSATSGSDGMNVTIQQGDLSFGVNRALGSVSAKSPLPLLSCVLLEAEKGGLRITGTDLDVTTSAILPCTVKTPGRVAVSARHFHDVVRKLSRGPLSLAVTDHQCEIR